MKKQETISVVTGGGSGIGLAAAKALGKHSRVVISGRTEGKLIHAVSELKKEHVEALPFVCDVSDTDSVDKLVEYAKSQGHIRAVVHSAGLSPHMGDAWTILATNVLGTININNAFFHVMEKESCLIDIASMGSYFIPRWLIPKRYYSLCRTDKELFAKKLFKYISLFPKNHRSNIAYVLSKNFDIWLAKGDAARFGEKGIRILSVSPGNFETPMGDLEHNEALKYIQHSALKRFGRVDEIGFLLDACTDPRMGYLTGIDIPCDGGCIASGLNPLKMLMHPKKG